MTMCYGNEGVSQPKGVFYYLVYGIEPQGINTEDLKVFPIPQRNPSKQDKVDRKKTIVTFGAQTSGC